MSRTAQDVLEFDKLRELLRLRTTCAPGRRAVNGLEPGVERAALESVFALIREAGEWLRVGRELGFGALADPQGWLGRIEGPVWRWSRANSWMRRRCWKRRDGCGSSFAKKR